MSTIRYAAVAAMAMFATGCGELLSIHPLATKDNSIFDSALIGVWSDGDDLLLRVTEDKPAAYDILWMSTKDSDKVKLKARLVQLRDQKVLDVWPADPTPFSIPGHAFLLVRTVGDGLELRFLDSKWLRAKVRESGAPAHVLIEGDPLITGTTPQVEAFLLKFGLSAEAQDDPLRLRRLER
jgi:hypothetical protein